MEEEFLPLRSRMNLETARISWAELARHFAAGRVVLIQNDLDLVNVAACFVEDKATQIQTWLQEHKLQILPDETAKRWVTQDPDNLWAVVVAPWVLVQERGE